MALDSEASVLDTSGGKTSAFSVLLLVGDDPVDARISSDGLVEGVDHDHFVEFVGSILSHPVRVEDSQVSASLSNSFLSDGSVGSSRLELSDTLVDWLSVNDTLGNGLLSSSSSDSNSIDDISLLSLVAHLSGLLNSGRSGASVDGGELSVFPGSDSEHESQHIRLLLFPKFFQVLVGTHLKFSYLIMIKRSYFISDS